MFGFATLLAAGAIGGAALLAGISQQDTGPRTIVVAQDGSADVTTIAAGVELAVDGDTVLVRPGVYPESVVIDEEITLAGDGPREEVIVEGTAGLDDVTEVDGPYSFVLRDSDATITGLTVRGMAGGMVILGGAPTLEGLRFEGTGVPFGSSDMCTDERGCGNSLFLAAGSTAVVRESQFVGGADFVVDGDANPLIEGNELRDGPHFYLAGVGDLAVIRDNTVAGALQWAIGIFDADTRVLIEGNRLSATSIGLNASAGFATIRDNDIAGAFIGIDIPVPAEPVVESNRIHDNLTGIQVRSTGAVIDGNTVSANRTIGIDVAGTADPSIVDNIIEGNGTGIRVGAGSTPTMEGNALCGNGMNYEAVPPGPLPSGNSACVSASQSAEPSAGT